MRRRRTHKNNPERKREREAEKEFDAVDTFTKQDQETPNQSGAAATFAPNARRLSTLRSN